MAEYTYAEVAYVHAMFGQTYGSECEACCMYQDHFLHCWLSDLETFSTCGRWLQENGAFSVREMTMGDHEEC